MKTRNKEVELHEYGLNYHSYTENTLAMRINIIYIQFYINTYICIYTHTYKYVNKYKLKNDKNIYIYKYV